MDAFATLQRRAQQIWQARQTNARVDVVMGSCSIAAGAQETLEAVRETVQGAGLNAEVGIVGDLGTCWAEPIIRVTLPGQPAVLYGPVHAADVPAFLDHVVDQGNLEHPQALWAEGHRPVGQIAAAAELPYFQIQNRRLIGRTGIIDPENIAHYLATGGYEGFNKALDMVQGNLSQGQQDIIKMVSDSGITGRGGANFPMGRKWDFLRTATASPKYMVCNADEGDPGAFVNRIIMESDPHLLLEGILIGCVAGGAEFGYIYIRDEYPVAVARMRTAVEQAREWGLLGKNVLGSGLDFDMEVVRGAGAYVCGEETGLIASIQDYRGMPRIKPPFPAQAGIFMKPTNVNNVESYASAPFILVNGAESYSSVGTERAKGTKIWSLSGDIRQVCIVETDLGVPLRTLFELAGGGLREPSRTLKAIQPGGPLGGFIRGDMVNIVLEPAAFAAESVMMGSGGFVFMDDHTCVVDMAKRLLAFDSAESCGRCTTCRAGSMRMVDIMARITSGRSVPTDLDLMRQYISFMPNANCAHGQLTPGPINGSMKFFMDEYLEHINDRRCRSLTCTNMVEYQVDPERSAAASVAIPSCPTGAIVQDGGRTVILQERCIKCGICAGVAPDAIRVGSPAVAWPARELAGVR